jgi:hypothetical protein
MSDKRQSIDPTYDARKSGEPYTVEVREEDRRVSRIVCGDPFINTTVHPRGWRAALAVLRRRYSVSVHVGACPPLVEDVLELNADYKGVRGSSRRREWDQQLEGSLMDFVAREAEHDLS